MRRSKIIIELIRDEINVIQAMDILNLLLQDIDNDEIKLWLTNEINGYENAENVPEYRIVQYSIVGTYICGSLYNSIKGTNQELPLKPEYIEEYSAIKVCESINQIMQYSIAEKETEHHSLSLSFHPAIAQKISMINGQIISAHRKVNIYAYTNILNRLKTKVLNIFIELEKEYGNLDDFYIDFNNDKKGQTVIQNITNIINDNSIRIGNGNKIESSNVGVDNEN